MSEAANHDCPQCDGRLSDAPPDPQTWRCERCDREIRQVVAENAERFRRVAESDGPAAELARAALGWDDA
jgi:tRNA(Ile2) C34 agmatinyltransferase TiaS